MPSESKSQTEQIAPGILLQQIQETNLSRQPRVTFPLPHFPTETGWRHGRVHHQQEFGGPRFDDDTQQWSRRHAGVDLEAPIGTDVLAMADGIVLRVAYFYNQTSEITVLVQELASYGIGEVNTSPKWLPRDVGAFVHQGEPIAKVGQRFDKAGKPNSRAMVHLEFFSDETRNMRLGYREKNQLSEGKPGTAAHPTFRRRSDMEDPTNLVESAPLWKPPSYPETWPQHLTATFCFFAQTPMSRTDEAEFQSLLRQAELFRER